MNLEQSINQFWTLCREALGEEFDFSQLPTDLSDLIERYAQKKVKQKDIKIVSSVIGDKNTQKQNKGATEILKLFDASSNGYRSATNVLLEYLKIQRDFDKGVYDLPVGAYATLDSVPIQHVEEIENKQRCPVCNRFPQQRTAFALITGGPQTDSAYQTYRTSQAKRSSLSVCQYCFMAGWVDLPTTKIVKDGQNVNKGREYLFITSPLAKSRLEKMLDLIAEHGRQSGVASAKIPDDEPEELTTLDSLTLELCAEFGVELSDPLSVLGMSTRRLRELRGFVLQSSNQLQRIIVLRVPLERIVGEDKISGAVRRELIKATMYDFWLITGGSLHYQRIAENTPFSVDGQPVTRSEMFRANCAYRIANRYARVGKYRQLNSALFMLLLSHPCQAANRIFNAKKREKGGRYALGSQKVKEIIQMIEEITQEKDWQFQLGLRIVETLVETRLAPNAKGFWKNPKEQYSGVELVKWIQRIKMIRDANSARAWGTSLINGYRREQGRGANTEVVERILTLVEEIIATCSKHNTSLTEFGRTVANMDYYLLFYYNQNIANKENA